MGAAQECDSALRLDRPNCSRVKGLFLANGAWTLCEHATGISPTSREKRSSAGPLGAESADALPSNKSDLSGQTGIGMCLRPNSLRSPTLRCFESGIEAGRQRDGAVAP